MFLAEPAVIAAVDKDETESADLAVAFHLWQSHAEGASPFPRIPSTGPRADRRATPVLGVRGGMAATPENLV